MQITDLPTEILYSIAVNYLLPHDTLRFVNASKLLRKVVCPAALKATNLLKSKGLAAYLSYMSLAKNSDSEHEKIHHFLAAKFPNRKALVFHAFQFGDIDTIKKLERELGKNAIIGSLRLIKKRAQLYPERYPDTDKKLHDLGYGDITIEPLEDRFRKLKSYLEKNEFINGYPHYTHRILDSFQPSFQPKTDIIDDSMSYSPNISFDHVSCLIEFGADILKSNAFREAVISYRFEIVRLFIDKGVDINQRFDHKKTAIHFAVQNGSYSTAELLIDNGIDLNVGDHLQNSALHMAARSGILLIVKLLLETGADIHVRNRQGVTPLTCASKAENYSIVNLLIEKGADINAQDFKGNTALHATSESGIINSVKLLIEKGADINAQNRDDNTALHMASEAGQVDIVDLLIKKGAKVNVLNNRGQSTLKSALSSYNFEVANIILNSGVDLNYKIIERRTAMNSSN